MRHLYVTGTDTGVGKTRVTAALARAARDAGRPYDVVKLVQTGLVAGEQGDAEEAGRLAGCTWREFHRFALPSDPWAAALAAGERPLEAVAIAGELAELPGAAIVEGSGGAAVPLNADESLSDAARAAGCEVVVAIGLRLGCISHAVLTLEYLTRRGFIIRGAILCEAWGPTEQTYRDHVTRALASHVRVAGTLDFDPNAARAVPLDATQVASLLSTGGPFGPSQRSSVARR
jgi:dethiobiotin synthetase